MTFYHIIRNGLACGLAALALAGCQKLIQVPEPTNTVTTEELFTSDALANSAMAGMYTFMMQGTWSNGIITQYSGLSSDELIDFQGVGDVAGYQLNSNTLLATNNNTPNCWNPTYSSIYQANAIIAALPASTGISDSVIGEYTGEAKIVRALAYFYLTNLFGDVPLPLTPDYTQNYLMSQTPQAQVYQQIVQDLKDAKTAAAADFSVGGGERIRPTKWAAGALLSRVYLYEGDWADAEAEADSVIANNSLFSLVTDPAAVFNTNSTEAIWQLKQNNTSYANDYNATFEGYTFIPYNSTSAISYYLAPQQLAAFEPGDLRYTEWVNSYAYTSNNTTTTYYYPYKYTVGPAQTLPGGVIPQYYMVLRLAELYLIRAEARAHTGTNLTGAAADLNAIRSRAGLPPTTASTGTDLLTAVAHERQTELFAEWGHRWLDLKRTGQALNVLSPIPLHAAISQDQLLYPIPSAELSADPHLVQNAGY